MLKQKQERSGVLLYRNGKTNLQNWLCWSTNPSNRIGNLTSQLPTIFCILKSTNFACKKWDIASAAYYHYQIFIFLELWCSGTNRKNFFTRLLYHNVEINLTINVTHLDTATTNCIPRNAGLKSITLSGVTYSRKNYLALIASNWTQGGAKNLKTDTYIMNDIQLKITLE